MANACGAFAVSCLLCAPEYPTIAELDAFLANRKHQNHCAGYSRNTLQRASQADLAVLDWA
jgi:hypothetical protein